MLIIHLWVNGTQFLTFQLLVYMLQYCNKNYFIEALARFDRLLIIMMNVYETACLKLDVIILPLDIRRKSYSSNLCPNDYFFRGPKCKIVFAVKERTPRPSHARSPRSLPVLLGDPLTRILAPPPPPKMLTLRDCIVTQSPLHNYSLS